MDANIFEAKTKTGFKGWFSPGDNLVANLKAVVAGIYETLRNFCAIGMLCMLIYTGIRIVLASASVTEQKEWKNRLMDWVKALILLITIHFFMIGVFYICNVVMDAMKGASGESATLNLTQQIAEAEVDSFEATEQLILLIIYAYVSYLTIVFAVAYSKRLMWVIVLIVIAPVVAFLYCFGKEGKRIFQNWLKEFIMTVLIQPYHFLIYYILIALPINLISITDEGWGAWSAGAFDPTKLFTYVYCLIALSMIRPFEKFLRQLLGMNQGKIANETSFESGKQTLNVGKEFVKDIGRVVAAVYTGGASMKVTGAPGKSLQMAKQGREMAGTGETPEMGSGNEGAQNAGGGALTEGGNTSPAENGANTATDQQSNGTTEDGRFTGVKRRFSERLADHIENGTVLSSIGNGISQPFSSAGEGISNTKERFKNWASEKADKTAVGRVGKAIAIRGFNSAKFLTTPDGRQLLSNLARSGNILRDTMYLSGDAVKDWEPRVKKFEEKTVEKAKINLENFVNNSENIKIAMNWPDKDGKSILDKRKAINPDNEPKAIDEAKELAKAQLKNYADPYLKKGITDPRTILSLIDKQKATGLSPDVIVKATLPELSVNSRTEVNNNSRVEAFNSNQANIENVFNAQRSIASQNSGRSAQLTDADIARIKKEVQPYVANGVSDPEVLARLTEIEKKMNSNLNSERVQPATPQEVIKIDQLIEKLGPAYGKNRDKVIEGINRKIKSATGMNKKESEVIGKIVKQELESRAERGLPSGNGNTNRRTTRSRTENTGTTRNNPSDGNGGNNT